MDGMPRESPHTRSLGERLRDLRESEGRTLREVAAKAGVNHGYLSQLERGEVSEPAPSMLHKIADAYGESFLTLMRWAGYVESDESGITTNQARGLSYLGDDVSDRAAASRQFSMRSGPDVRPSPSPLPVSTESCRRATPPRSGRRSSSCCAAPMPSGPATRLDQVLEVSELVVTGEITSRSMSADSYAVCSVVSWTKCCRNCRE